MDIKIAREVAARIWCDQEMSSIVMDVELVEEIAQLLASRLTPRAADVCQECGETETIDPNNDGVPVCVFCGTRR